MTVPPRHPRPARAALLAILLLASACAPPQQRPRAECRASRELLDSYASRVAGLVSNKSRGDVLDPHETVWVSFAVDATGVASAFRVERAKRAESGQEVVRAAAAAAPFPRPPFDPEACLVDGRVTISLIGHVRCDDAGVDHYIEAVVTRIRQAVASAGTITEAGDKVALRMKVDRKGTPLIKLHDAQSAEVGERVASIARGLAPYEAPGDSIAQCIADLPFFVWVELPGVTRGPIPIHR